MESNSFTTIEEWKEYAQSKLPPKPAVKARNKKITCIYASLYHQYPSLLKWAGMASFASHKVGLALLPFELYQDKEGCVDLDSVCEGYGVGLMDDLSLIRYTNNKVYDDIAWAHFAYVSTRGGIDLIQDLLNDDQHYCLVSEGFLNIEKGKSLLEAESTRRLGEQYIWFGNTLLLKHEQLKTVQPMFTRLDFAFRKFLALATAMDFDANHDHTDWKTYTSFYTYMWLWGKGILIKTRSLPSIVNFEHRWSWIDRRMLKIWKRVEQSDKKLKEKIAGLLEFENSIS